MNQEFELLAPAGSFEILKAVIEAGADAVYVGGGRFGARAYANNFSEEELLEAIDYAHLRGKQVYLTINTLLKNEEMKQLYQYLLPYYEGGLDAVLVQDFGVLQFIHKNFPDLPIHTSTQMTVTGVEGVLFLKQFGVTRVVMAREVSLEEMKYIQEQTGMELEAFVHGALCYCYSGQCLFSSMLGGRSGNRGRCAQPCRLAYSVLDEKKKEFLSDSYVLSLKDLCGIEDIPKLYEAGVFSLKIEGRMKQAEYAAGVVSYYRKYIDQFVADRNANYKVSQKDKKSLEELGNRCGFTDTYYHKHNGKHMVTFVKPNYSTDNEALHHEVLEKYVHSQRKLPISGYLYLRKGEEVLLTVSYGEHSVAVKGDVVLEAQNRPMLLEDVDKRIRKTGDTSFAFEELVIDMEDGIFLPNGAMNKLRREALEELMQHILQQYRRKSVGEISEQNAKAVDTTQGVSEKEQYIVSVEERRQLCPVLEMDWISTVYMDWNTYDKKRLTNDLLEDLNKITMAGKEGFLVLPAVSRQSTIEYIKEIAAVLSAQDLSGFVVKTYEELYLVKRLFPDKKIVIDHNLYNYNDWAMEAFQREGATRVTIPLELNKKEIAHHNNKDSEIIIYGYYPLMTSAQCVHCNTVQCDKTPTVHYLKDRYQKCFPVKNHCNECYNMIYNSIPTSFLQHIDELKGMGINSFRFNFTLETPKEISDVLKAFEANANALKGEYTKGHYKRGVE